MIFCKELLTFYAPYSIHTGRAPHIRDFFPSSNIGGIAASQQLLYAPYLRKLVILYITMKLLLANDGNLICNL